MLVFLYTLPMLIFFGGIILKCSILLILHFSLIPQVTNVLTLPFIFLPFSFLLFLLLGAQLSSFSFSSFSYIAFCFLSSICFCWFCKRPFFSWVHWEWNSVLNIEFNGDKIKEQVDWPIRFESGHVLSQPLLVWQFLVWQCLCYMETSEGHACHACMEHFSLQTCHDCFMVILIALIIVSWFLCVYASMAIAVALTCLSKPN